MREYTISEKHARKYAGILKKKLHSSIGGFSVEGDDSVARAGFMSDEGIDFDALEEFLKKKKIPFDRFIDPFEDGMLFYRIYRPEENGCEYDEERQILDEDPQNIAISLQAIKGILESKKSVEDKLGLLEEFVKRYAFPPYKKIEDISKDEELTI